MKKQRSHHEVHALHITYLGVHVHYRPKHPAQSLSHRLLAKHRVLRECANHVFVDLIQFLHARLCRILDLQVLQLILLKVKSWEVNSEPVIASFANLGKF